LAQLAGKGTASGKEASGREVSQGILEHGSRAAAATTLSRSRKNSAYKWRDQLEPIDDGGAPPENSKERQLRLQVAQLKRLVADKMLEANFFKGVLAKSRGSTPAAIAQTNSRSAVVISSSPAGVVSLGPGLPGGAVTGAPYSAEEVTEHVQTLADGTHITQPSSKTIFYRDSLGRTRIERAFPLPPGASGATGPNFIEISEAFSLLSR